MKATYSHHRCPTCNNRLLYTGIDVDEAVREYLCEICNEEYEQQFDTETGHPYGDIELVGGAVNPIDKENLGEKNAIAQNLNN
ncbi:MAG TPA: hypothetical protein V6D28_27920 [Leptolyngbyaceae cyanobacterium]